MPYTTTNPPDFLKQLPIHAVSIWVSTFNNAIIKQHSDIPRDIRETTASKIAWSAVKKSYEKKGDTWVAKMSNHHHDEEEEEVVNTSADFDELIPISMEIFKSGLQTDSNGVKHDGEALINKAIELFNTSVHRPPIRLDHLTGPAYGWVKGLSKHSREGSNYLVMDGEIIPEAVDLIQRKLYTQRSAGFSKDGSLNHLALLGAAVPAVKGLAPINLEEDISTLLIFSENNNNIENNEEKDMAINDGTTAPSTLNDLPDIQKMLDEQKALLTKEFNEKIQKMEFEVKRKEIQTFMSDLVATGKITPAEVDGGLGIFMESLLNITTTFNFAESADITPIAWFSKYLSKRESLNLGGEFDIPKKRVSLVENEYDRLNQLAKEYEKENKVSFSEALDQVARIHKINVI